MTLWPISRSMPKFTDGENGIGRDGRLGLGPMLGAYGLYLYMEAASRAGLD